MSNSNNVLSFEQALKALNSLSETTLAKECWVPSCKTHIKLKEINAEQQKKLLSSTLEKTLVAEKIHFEQFIYQVLKQNNLSEALNINNLTVLDRSVLALALRHQVSSHIDVRFFDSNQKEYTEKIDLGPLVEKIKNYEHPEQEEVVFDKSSLDVRIIVDIPKLGLDNFYYENTPFLKNNKDTSNEKILNDMIVEGFILETSKYIKNILLDGQDLSYLSWNLNQKTFFIEKLPVFIVQNIFEKIASWKSSLDSYFKVQSSLGDEAILDINSMSFLS